MDQHRPRLKLLMRFCSDLLVFQYSVLPLRPVSINTWLYIGFRRYAQRRERPLWIEPSYETGNLFNVVLLLLTSIDQSLLKILSDAWLF